jgi:hypothetical protein
MFVDFSTTFAGVRAERTRARVWRDGPRMAY